MIVIGEKLNGAIPEVAEMIAKREKSRICGLAGKQADAGADFIDVCAAVESGEVEILRWMIETVQSAVDVPISIDSPDVEVLREVYPVCKRPGLFNSASMENRRRIDLIFRIMSENPGWEVVAMLCDDKGISHSTSCEERLRIFEEILKKAEEYGIEPSRIHIDPMAEAAVLMDVERQRKTGIQEYLDTIRAIRRACPDVHIVSAISNVSHGLPARKYLNYSFAAMALEAGLDSAILDPLDVRLRGVIHAAETLLGRKEEGCLEYIRDYRSGKF